MRNGLRSYPRCPARARRTLNRYVLAVGGATLLVLTGCGRDDDDNDVVRGEGSVTRPASADALFRDADIDRNNQLSRDEIRRWWRGRVDEREFAPTPRERTYLDAWDHDHDSRYDDDEVANGLLEAFDANRDGRMDRDEWEAANRDADWAGL